MSGLIEVGDLVRVATAASCCGNNAAIGKIFIVEAIGKVMTRCARCKKLAVVVCALLAGHCAVPVTRLRRIPPLSELESQDTHEEIPA